MGGVTVTAIAQRTRTVGDRLIPLTETLIDEDGSVLGLTGCSVRFRMIHESGAVKVDSVPAEVVIAATGRVSYEFEPADVDTPGLYFYWFLVSDEDGLRERWPRGGRRRQLLLVPDE
jgi:hypothetical protein